MVRESPKLLPGKADQTLTFDLHPTLAADSFLVARVGAVQVRLMNDARYFWLLVVPETSATELHDLDPALADHMWRVVTALGAQLKTHTDAVKINTAAIGNMVPQLHIHIVARHRDDPDWPRPIWGASPPLALSSPAKTARLSAVQSWLGN